MKDSAGKRIATSLVRATLVASPEWGLEHGDNDENALNFCEDGGSPIKRPSPSLLSSRYDRYSLGSRVVGLVEDNRGHILSDHSIIVDGQDVKQVPLSLRDGRAAARRKSI